ncbi:hypothetical protein T492DRAFT_983278 [Pavlovales sp. CCMP2436]|nr:hypothetical protein T492DRAFT_983278 [Pavlovales sp. CCMP2436]
MTSAEGAAEPPAELVAAQERTAQLALRALVEAMRQHPAEVKALEYVYCAVWNLLLSSAERASEFAHALSADRGDSALALTLEALRSHARATGVALYAIAVLLALVEVPGAAARMLAAGVVGLAQDVARVHSRNERMQEGVLALVEALEAAELAALAAAGRAPPGWTPVAHAQWLLLAAQLKNAFADLSPDATAFSRMLATLRTSYHRLARVFRHFASAGPGWRDAPLGAATVGMREWLALAKTCRLATRSYDRAQLTRAFAGSAPEPVDELAEPAVNWAQFVHVVVLVAFERLNPFWSEWLLGDAPGDVPLVPIDEAVSHLLDEQLFALSDLADRDVLLRLCNNERVMSAVALHRGPLEKVFGKYAARNSPSATEVVMADVLHLLRAISYVPARLSAAGMRLAFADSLPDGGVESLWHGEAAVAGAYGLDLDAFCECLCRCAVSKLAAGHSEVAPATAEAAAQLVVEIFGEVQRANIRGAFDALGGTVSPLRKSGGARPAGETPTLPSLTTVKLLPVAAGPNTSDAADDELLRNERGSADGRQQ